MGGCLDDSPGPVLDAYGSSVNGKSLAATTDLWAPEVHLYDARGSFDLVCRGEDGNAFGRGNVYRILCQWWQTR